MKYFLSILIILSLSFISLEDENVDYSLIINNVRKDVVKKAYSDLPSRTSQNILKMCNLMNKAKEDYSLNQYEAVYLVYYWISLNIKINCEDAFSQYSSAVNTFNEGKSSSVGISALFSTMVSNLGIQSNNIEGVSKINTDNNENGELIETKEYVWNYALIENKYYLFDPTKGTGYCNGKTFVKQNLDFFFGTNPDYLIYTNYPDNSKWQLLDNIVSKSQFDSWPYVNKWFYLYEFKTFSPVTYEIELKPNLEIELTFDKSKNLSPYCDKVIYKNKVLDFSPYSKCKISDGVYKVTFEGNEIIDYIILYAGFDYETQKKSIIFYKIKK